MPIRTAVSKRVSEETLDWINFLAPYAVIVICLFGNILSVNLFAFDMAQIIRFFNNMLFQWWAVNI